MTPVMVEGVRRNFGISSIFMYTVSLVYEAEQRFYPIGLERHDALPIVAALHHLTLPRPQTINIMVDTFKLHNITLIEARIEDCIWLSSIYLFTTTLLWRDGDGSEIEQKQSMRPGDVIGLSLLMNCPLFLSDDLAQRGITLAEGQTPELYQINELLRREGIVLPEGKKLRLGYSKTPMRDALVKEFKVALSGKAPPFPEEDMEQRKKEILAFLLR